MNLKGAIFVGQINTDGNLIVSDPCYSLGTWCAAQVQVVPGDYLCFVKKENLKDWGERITKQYIINLSNFGVDEFEICKIYDDIGVDSAQCGIFDYSWFSEFKNNDGNVGDNFAYYTILDNKGFVTWCGIGDGTYELYTIKANNGDIVGLVVDYSTDLEFKDFE